MSSGDLAAAHVYYTGRVQGVGFRATTVHLAAGFPVTGWVRNLPDGRVELLAEGSRADVESFLKAVREEFAGTIHGEAIDWQPATGKFKQFDVTRGW